MALLSLASVLVDVSFPSSMEFAAFNTAEGFKSTRRTTKLDSVVIHNSAGTQASLDYAEGVARTLNENNHGAHFVIAPIEGDPTRARVRQFADPYLDSVSHASGTNERAIGVECIGPVSLKASSAPQKFDKYWPTSLRFTSDFFGGLTFVPSTQGQCEALYQLWTFFLGFQRDQDIRRVSNIPFNIVGLRAEDDNPTLAVKDLAAKDARGLVAHAQISGHADGLFELVYCTYRARGKSDASDAYDAALTYMQQQSNKQTNKWNNTQKVWPARGLYQPTLQDSGASSYIRAADRNQAALVASAWETNKGPVFTRPSDSPTQAAPTEDPYDYEAAARRGIYVSDAQLRLYDVAKGVWVNAGG